MATAKTSKAKASAKTTKTTSKASKAKASAPKQLNTTLNLMVIPNKNQQITGICNLAINGNKTPFTVHKAHNICLNSIGALGNSLNAVKQVFCTLYANYVLPANMQYGLKKQYGMAYGIIAKQASYKAVAVHHKANGNNAIIINQCNSFTYTHASTLASKHGITLLQGKAGKANWGILQVTQSNIQAVINYIVALLNLTPATAKQ